MSNLQENKIVDNWEEHNFHNNYDPNCSSCFTEDKERSAIIENLTDKQEEKLREKHAEFYTGTDDMMPDAFEMWLEDLSVEELKEILK